MRPHSVSIVTIIESAKRLRTMQSQVIAEEVSANTPKAIADYRDGRSFDQIHTPTLSHIDTYNYA